MKYIKDNIISSSPSIPFVSNPSYETILVNGWEVYIEPEVEETDWLHDYPKRIEAKEAILLKPEAPIMFMKISSRGLPVEEIEKENGELEYHIYVYKIREDDQYIIDKYPDLLKVVDRD